MYNETEAYLVGELNRLHSMRFASGSVIFQGSQFPIMVSFEEGPDGPRIEVSEIKDGVLFILPRIHQPLKPKKTKGRK